MAIKYRVPERWIKYDPVAIIDVLTDAKSAVQSLTTVPFQRSWAERLQEIELKREVAGTSRIEGADFTEREFEEAVSGDAPDEQLSRSQRQARAAIHTYRWIARLPAGRPIDESLIREIHRRIVTGCDDDHCPPGQFRISGQNVSFGRPQHRGVEGGKNCNSAMQCLVDALSQEFRSHDALIQALALHYHIGAMHPFLDGNGRTARVLEALVLRQARFKDALFVSMSNFYYDEKNDYLACLSEAWQSNHDLTPFLIFGLRGIAVQCQRLLRDIRTHLQRSLFRDVMGQLYGRLRSTRKRALALRQIEILNRLLDREQGFEMFAMYETLERQYGNLKEPVRAYIRDLNHLSGLRAITVRNVDGENSALTSYIVKLRLEWATEITETEFYRQVNQLPKAKTRLITAA